MNKVATGQGGSIHRVQASQKQARRGFLKAGSLLAGSLIASPCAPLLAASSARVDTRLLSDRVLLVRGPDANVLAVDSEEGLLLMDGGHASWSDSLHQALAGHFPGRSVRSLFNTHWHREQTGSNELLGSQGVEIIAHENTRQWLGTEVWQRWSDTVFAPLPKSALPDRILGDQETLRIGGHSMHVNLLWKSHTDGDICVYLEEENILVCGGMISNGLWPEIDWWTGGYTGGMLDSLVLLLTFPDETTRIIPAWGEEMTLAELKAQNAMYVTVFERLHELFLQSYSLDEILAEKPTAEFDKKMGDPTLFLTLAFQSLMGHLRDPQNFRLLNLP